MTEKQQGALDKLNAIGVNEISLRTSIVKKYVEMILKNDVEDIYNVKLNGFLTIIEKEYDVDLGFMKKEKPVEDPMILENKIREDNEQTRKKVYIGGLFLVLVLLYVSINYLNSKNEISISESVESGEIDKSEPAPAPEVKAVAVANNATQTNATTSVAPTPVVVSTPVKQGQLLIKAPVAVWYGHVYLKTGFKENKTIKGEHTIALEDETYIAIVNRDVTFVLNNQTVTLGDNNGDLIYIRYKNGALDTISRKVYTEETKGKGWY